MTNTVERTCSYDVAMSVELTANGFELVGFRVECAEPHFSGRVSIEGIIDSEIEYSSLYSDEPARGRVDERFELQSEGRRLNEDGIADMLDYREMLLRGVDRIDQYILEIGDE